jgi:Protein involved in biosynthesis of mitomycin antibiotics/polyketide fumonisin
MNEREQDELDVRLADRDREYQRRIASLDKAASGISSESGGVDMRFAQLLALVKAVVAQMHTQGYVIIPNLLDLTQVERVRDAMAPLFATTRRMFEKLDPQKPRHTFHIQNVLAKSRAADEVAINPLLRAIVGGILGQDFILHAGAVAMSPDPGCSSQELHRDDGSYALLPRPRLPLVVTAAIALDDFTKENGGTQIVPGSCCWPASRRPEPEEVIQCEMSAGSVLLWDGAVFHGGGGNITKDQTRRTLTLNYTRGWLRTQYNQFLSIPRELVMSMPPELQADLGYHVSARGLGTCDNQDPLAYLRKMFLNGGDGAQPMLGEEMD